MTESAHPASLSLACGKSNSLSLARWESIISGFLGSALILAAPTARTQDVLLFPLLGSYRFTLFDVAVLLAALSLLVGGRLHVHPRERLLFGAVVVVICSRVISLLAARIVAGEQVLSVFRHVETLTVLFVLANLLAERRNRRSFVAGAICAALAETMGGLLIFFLARGEERGVWLSVDAFQLQVFLLLAWSWRLIDKKRRLWTGAACLGLILGLFATQTRSAILLLLLTTGLAALLLGRHSVKPILALVCLGSLAFVPLLLLFPQAAESFTARAEQLWQKEGGIGYRLVLLDMARVAFEQSPLTGIGSGGFARQQDYLYPKSSLEFDPEYLAYDPVGTHNTVLGTLAETGTIGLLAYLLWVLAVMRACRQPLRRFPQKLNQYAYLAGGAVCVIGLTISDLWGQASFTPIASCLLGFVMGGSRELSRDASHGTSYHRAGAIWLGLAK